MATIDLSILIVNFNTPEWVNKALTSIEKYIDVSYEIIVVDNGSDDYELRTVMKNFPAVQLIEVLENKGFAGGNNIGLKVSRGKYILLLNSDAEFTSNTQIKNMIGYMDEHPKIAVMSPRIELPSGKLDMASHRGEPTPWASFTHFSGLAKLFSQSEVFAQYHQTFKDFQKIHEIDACSGAAMLVRATAINKVGYLDDEFFMYAEDLDWCKRFREAGYTVVYFPKSVIIHHKYKSGRGSQDQAVAQKISRHFYETMLQYYDKHYKKTYPFFVRWGIQLFIYFKVRR